MNTNLRQITLVALATFSIGVANAEDASQVVDALTGKAISTIESGINEFANDIANSFGKGRTSISIKGIESEKPNYSIDTIQPISAFNSEIKELTFVQGSLASGENEGDRRNTLNLGLGQRYLVEDQRAIAGINLFVDYEGTSKHKRASLGLEYERSNFSISANKYYPVSDKKAINGYTEEVLPGYDVNLTGQMPYAPWASIKGTHYYWDQTVGDNINGNILGIEIQLSPSTSIEFGQEDSNTSNKQSHAKLSIKLPFDDTEKMTNFALDDQPFRAQAMMDLSSLNTFKRNNKIKIEKLNIAPVFTSDVSASVAENQTSAITLVATDVHGVSYSISGTDSALFNVDSSTGVVTFKTAPDYESPSDSGTNNVYDFTAITTDTNGLATTQSVSIAVTDVSEAVTMTDGSGNTYVTVTIAAANGYSAQTWTATNLKTTKYIDGTDVTGVYSYSNNTANDADGYGKLYTWNAATNTTAATSETDNVLGICGTGWHIPTDKDWKNLEGLQGMSTVYQDVLNLRGTDEGTKLKVGGTSGFEAKLAGYRDFSESFYNRGDYAFLWSSTELGGKAYSRTLLSSNAKVYRGINNKTEGYSVRCIKD